MKSILRLSIYAIILALLYVKIVQMKSFVKMTNAVCESKNKSWVTIEECRLRAISRNKTTFNMESTIIYPAYNIDFRLQVQKKASGYKPWLADYIIDGCAFMRKPNHPGVKLFLDMFRNYSTVNHTCPYVGKQMLKDFYYDPKNLTLPAPSGDYALLLTWIFDKKPQFTVNVYFTFYQDNILFQ